MLLKLLMLSTTLQVLLLYTNI